MGNSRHGGRKFRSIREAAQRRSREGAANARREAEADIRPAVYVGPNGRGYDVVQDQNTGEQYVVKDMSGGHTMAPGSIVPIYSYSGSHAEARLGAPPGGGSKFGSPSRNRRPYGTVTPAAVANQYAFYSADGETYAWLYQDGEYVSDRGQIGEELGASGIILSDSQEIVGDGSAICCESWGSSSFKVYDVVGDVVYSYTAPAGWLPCIPQYAGGYLWWAEAEIPNGSHTTTEIDVRLRRASCDLSDATTIGSSFTTPALGGSFTHYDPNGLQLFGVAITATGVIAYLDAEADDVAHATGDPWPVHRIHWTFAGAVSSDSTHVSSDDFPVGTGMANSAGDSVISVGPGSRGGVDPATVYEQADSESSDPTERWDGAIYSDPTGPTEASFDSFNVNAAGSVCQVYAGGFLGRASATATATAWSAKAATEAHPIVAQSPSQMFYFGD